MLGLRRLALEQLQSDWLRRWWCKKYSAPPTDYRYLAYTQEQLVVEYLEDKYEESPSAFYEKDPDGETLLQDERVSVPTGDADVDEVSRLIASGKTAEDIMDDWEQQAAAVNAAMSKDTTAPVPVAVESIDDDYASFGGQ